MWRRLRRRSFAPRRPLMFAEQLGIVMLSAFAIAGGIVAVVLLLGAR